MGKLLTWCSGRSVGVTGVSSKDTKICDPSWCHKSGVHSLFLNEGIRSTGQQAPAGVRCRVSPPVAFVLEFKSTTKAGGCGDMPVKGFLWRKRLG